MTLRNRPVEKKSISLQADSEEESDLDVEELEKQRSKPKGSVKVTRPGSALPSSKDNDSRCNVTSVKILKIKTPNSLADSADEITKALDERNRKNAEMAKQNRLKKKAYISNLEKEVEESKKRAEELETKMNRIECERDDLLNQILSRLLSGQALLMSASWGPACPLSGART